MNTAKSNNPIDFRHIVIQHLDWYPRMQIEDTYKLLYQGILGPEHLMPTRQEFSRHLQLEFESLVPDEVQPLFVPIRSDNTLFRLNLRTYKTRELPVDPLVPLFLETSRLVAGTKEELKDAWVRFVQLCGQVELGAFQFPSVHEFSSWLEEADYPAVHHSQVYRREYQPAYRLISAQFIPQIGKINGV